MPFWGPTTPYNQATGERLGPYFDLFVGTEGITADVYDAYMNRGARRIILVPGAILSADLTIAANDVVIWSPLHRDSLNLGAHKIVVSGLRCQLGGFKISGAAGNGIEVQGDAMIERVAIYSCSGDGIFQNAAQNNCTYSLVRCEGNTGNGIRIGGGAGNHANVHHCLLYGNTQYGLNDGLNSSIVVGNRIAANTAGQINGTPSVNTGNKTT